MSDIEKKLEALSACIATTIGIAARHRDIDDTIKNIERDRSFLDSMIKQANETLKTESATLSHGVELRYSVLIIYQMEGHKNPYTDIHKDVLIDDIKSIIDSHYNHEIKHLSVF